MADFGFFVGIDVSSSQTILSKSFPYSLEGFNQLHSILQSLNQPALITMESTSIYFLNLFVFLNDLSYTVFVINPNLISKFVPSTRNSKSDKSDADKIALFILKNHSELSLPNPNILNDFRLFFREREKLVSNASTLKDEILKLLFILFPELEKSHINIFSNGMLHFLLKFPSAHSVRTANLSALQKHFSKVFNRKNLTFLWILLLNLPTSLSVSVLML